MPGLIGLPRIRFVGSILVLDASYTLLLAHTGVWLLRIRFLFDTGVGSASYTLLLALLVLVASYTLLAHTGVGCLIARFVDSYWCWLPQYTLLLKLMHWCLVASYKRKVKLILVLVYSLYAFCWLMRWLPHYTLLLAHTGCLIMRLC
jgi:hypothetical protein